MAKTFRLPKGEPLLDIASYAQSERQISPSMSSDSWKK